MQFKFNEQEYRIMPDTYCWILQLKIQRKPGAKPLKEGSKIWKDWGYYNNLYDVAKCLIDIGLKDTFLSLDGKKSLHEATNDVRNVLIAVLKQAEATID